MNTALNTSEVERVLRESLAEAVDQIKANLKANDKVASGDTLNSFSLSISGYRGKVEGAAYIEAVEKGRKAGKVPRNMTEILMRWIKAKGLSFGDEKDLQRWANAIKWKIIREGTYLHRSGKVIDIIDTPTQDAANTLSERISTLLQSEVVRILFNA